ncbi:MAG: hypothetical protein J0M26_18650 [Planctomycetes bacterium]|nr:hypothetical protein [Planctomycetota bacterium]
MDSTTLEADAVVKSIVRRDSSDGWRNYLIGLTRADAVIGADEQPVVEELQRFNKYRGGLRRLERNSYPDAEIAKKNPTTRLAHEAESIVNTE